MCIRDSHVREHLLDLLEIRDLGSEGRARARIGYRILHGGLRQTERRGAREQPADLE